MRKSSEDMSAVGHALEGVRKKLLDLTARNRLINFPINGKSTLRIINTSPNNILKKLMERSEVFFEPIKNPKEAQCWHYGFPENKRPDVGNWAERAGLFTNYVLLKTSNILDKKIEIPVLCYEDELQVRLRHIGGRVRSEIQEKGTNVFYFSFGFLEWSHPLDPEKKFLSPLFNIPVALEKKKKKRIESV